jgi:hypothetical protein
MPGRGLSSLGVASKTEGGSGNGRKLLIGRIAPRTGRFHPQRADLKGNNLGTPKLPEAVPKKHGSLRVEFSSKRNDPQNPMFPAVSVSPFLMLHGIVAGPNGDPS